MGLLDSFTGGKSDEAADALKRAEAYFTAIKAPTLQQLTLPQLQQYVEAGIITPDQAQAYLQQSNAYNNMNVDQTGTGAQVSAINHMAEVANAGPEGTPTEQAAIENAISQMNTSVAGQRGAIEQSMAAKGIPASLISAALQSQVVGQDASQAHADAMAAASGNYQAALQAMAQGGAAGNALQGQQNTQANTVAAAQNAMQQFNAQNQQQNSQFNTGMKNEANAYNAQNRQQISNNNTQLSNNRTAYNAALPQQMFNNDMGKAAGAAGAAQQYGNLIQQQGQQTAGINAGLINAAVSGASAFGSGGATAAGGGGGAKPPAYAPTSEWQLPGGGGYAHGGVVGREGLCMDDGGMVPGQPRVPGDSPMNDTIPITASPGEAVIPRSAVEQNPDIVASLIGDQDSSGQIDFQDVATLLKAMRALRMGVA